jgi:hypothetical protein
MEMHESHYTRFLDDVRAEAAVASRERQRVLEQLQRESATFLGVLTDLAEQRRQVHVRLDTGATVVGGIDLLGDDLVAVGGAWLRLGAVQAVRATGDGADRDEAVVADLDLAAVLTRLVEDRPRVVLHVLGGEPVRGELVAAGDDVVTVRLDGDGEVAYVPIAAVSGVRPTS